jgi:hypothetical protein
MNIVRNSQIQCFNEIGQFYECLQKKLDISQCKNELETQSNCIADVMTADIIDPQLRLNIHHSIIKSTEKVNFQYKIQEKNKKLISNCGKSMLRYHQCESFQFFSNEIVGKECRDSMKDYISCCGKIFEKDNQQLESFEKCWNQEIENFKPNNEEEFWKKYENCLSFTEELTIEKK